MSEHTELLRALSVLRDLARAADALERNPMANNLPRFRDPVRYHIGRAERLLEKHRQSASEVNQ